MKAKKVTGRLARVPGVHFKSSSNKVMKTLPANYFKNVSKDEMAAYHKGQLAEFYQRQKEMKREDQAACLTGSGANLDCRDMAESMAKGKTNFVGVTSSFGFCPLLCFIFLHRRISDQ